MYMYFYYYVHIFYLKQIADDLTEEKYVFSINAAFSFDDGQECMFD